ncbi:hypothetical protein F5J12DRAFT_853304 [Pisolithus orientalis]|uniref:uncharacterized protein n=1 Tax=Pisolithus orientalis TaxID=936130 RepID=UPI002224FF8F|nr:uncharacterized protein F5J12DRAFT_853304 [Pisolithus orientalis]KAI5996605.1 hypothetical protein F5J12DRAFT_853304 [Pisolithus orientalis]
MSPWFTRTYLWVLTNGSEAANATAVVCSHAFGAVWTPKSHMSRIQSTLVPTVDRSEQSKLLINVPSMRLVGFQLGRIDFNPWSNLRVPQLCNPSWRPNFVLFIILTQSNWNLGCRCGKLWSLDRSTLGSCFTSTHRAFHQCSLF